MSTPRPHDYSSEKCWCGEINPLVKYPPKEGVAAPLEPSQLQKFADNWMKEHPDEARLMMAPDRWYKFAEAYAAAVSKNLQEELAAPKGSMFANRIEHYKRRAETAEARILELEKEITALRETK